MTTIEPKYVSFKTAKLLQEKGFELNSSKCYNENGEEKTVALTARRVLHKEKVFYPRPELWVIQEWLLKEHKLLVATTRKGGWWFYVIESYQQEDTEGTIIETETGGGHIQTMYDAIEQGIVYCLNHLL